MLTCGLVLALGLASLGACADDPEPGAGEPAPTVATTTTTTTSPFPAADDPASPADAPLAGVTIHVDAGHNGGNATAPEVIGRHVDIGTQTRECDTPGTASNSGYAEHAFTLDVSLKLQRILEDAGATVVMTRATDDGVGPCIDERAAIGNDAGADVAVSIHADGSFAEGARGFHVIHPASVPGLTDDIAEDSRALAVAMRDAYADVTGMPYANYLGRDGLDERDDLGGLNLSRVPKVFLETGNMRADATDAPLLASDAFRGEIARALAIGLSAYLAARDLAPPDAPRAFGSAS